nr:hypothetical protein [Tanacetum cinerariifolium]
VTIEATPLSSKSPTIIDYKIYKEGRKSFSKSSEQMTKLLIKKLDNSEGEHQVWGRIVGIKRLHDDPRVNTAQVYVSVVKLNLVLFKLVKGSEKAVEGSEKDKEGISKRAASNLEQEDAKRQMI